MKLNNNKNQFIITFDQVVADKLKADGYTLLSNEDGKCTFINNGILQFDEDEDMSIFYDKMHYTNVLCMTN